MDVCVGSTAYVLLLVIVCLCVCVFACAGVYMCVDAYTFCLHEDTSCEVHECVFVCMRDVCIDLQAGMTSIVVCMDKQV